MIDPPQTVDSVPVGHGETSAPVAPSTAGRPLRAPARDKAALRWDVGRADSEQDLQAVFEHVLDQSMDLFGADRAGLWIMEDGECPFHLSTGRGLSVTFIAAVTGAKRGTRSLRERGAGAAAWRAVTERRIQVIEGATPPRPSRHVWTQSRTSQAA